MNPEVSVIIVSHGTRAYTLAALESVQKAGETIPLEAIVVDNASPDDSAEAVAREHAWARLIRSRENGGFGAGANLGAQAARGTWLLFLNSDARLPAGALAALLENAQKLPSPGAVGPWIENSDGKPELSAGHFFSPWRDFVRSFYLDRLIPGSGLEGLFIRPRRGPARAVNWVTGACMLLQRDIFERVGGFDEAYFMYVEDMDLCFRLVQLGRINYYVPAVTVVHELGKSRLHGRPVPFEGGNAPEYFLRKFRPGYPVLLQRALRAVGLLLRFVVLEQRVWIRRLKGQDATEARYTASRCRMSLLALFRSSS